MTLNFRVLYTISEKILDRDNNLSYYYNSNVNWNIKYKFQNHNTH